MPGEAAAVTELLGVWQFLLPEPKLFPGEALALLLLIPSTSLYFFHVKNDEGLGRKNGGKREPRIVIVCYWRRHQDWDLGGIWVKRKARKQRSYLSPAPRRSQE